MSSRKVRVRFAPSPTGPLHIGGVRTALFNYLFAKKHGGDFLLRIEDTDQGRYVPGAEDYIIESLRWCGLNFNEGVSVGGEYGPYRQSDRKPIYKQYADQLIANGNGYYAFDTPEELDEKRKVAEAEKKAFQYDSSTRLGLKNSLTMSKEEVEQKLASGEQYVIRMKVPENESITINDLIRGEVVFHSSQVDDKVLYKSDGMPTYHLANVVDDYLMKITHVIRGEEWLPSTPLHVLLYRALGWEASTPQFSHLPLILKPDGKGKLSKRDGDKGGFPVFPLRWTDPKSGEISSGYRESGYFPEAFINMLAFLGWNPGTEQEIFTIDELAQAFSLEKVGKSGSKFDPAKAKWFNQQYLRTKSGEELSDSFLKDLEARTIKTDKVFVQKIVELLKERVNFVHELWDQSYFFFEAPTSYDEASVKKVWKAETPALISGLREVLSGVASFDHETLHDAIKNQVESKQIGFGAVMNPLRMLMVGKTFGPDMMTILELLGKEEVLKRVDAGLKSLSN
jgi:glutamyl-tRNA synthetase